MNLRRQLALPFVLVVAADASSIWWNDEWDGFCGIRKAILIIMNVMDYITDFPVIITDIIDSITNTITLGATGEGAGIGIEGVSLCPHCDQV